MAAPRLEGSTPSTPRPASSLVGLGGTAQATTQGSGVWSILDTFIQNDTVQGAIARVGGPLAPLIAPKILQGSQATADYSGKSLAFALGQSATPMSAGPLALETAARGLPVRSGDLQTYTQKAASQNAAGASGPVAPIMYGMWAGEKAWDYGINRPIGTGALLTDFDSPLYNGKPITFIDENGNKVTSKNTPGFQLTDINAAWNRTEKVSAGQALAASDLAKVPLIGGVMPLFNMLGGVDKYDPWNDLDMEAAQTNPWYVAATGGTDLALQIVVPPMIRAARIAGMRKVGLTNTITSVEDLAFMRSQFDAHTPEDPNAWGDMVHQIAAEKNPSKIRTKAAVGNSSGADKTELSKVLAETDDPSTVNEILLADRGDVQAMLNLQDAAPDIVWRLSEADKLIYSNAVNGVPYRPTGPQLAKVNQIFDSALERNRYFADVRDLLTVTVSDGMGTTATLLRARSTWRPTNSMIVEKIRQGGRDVGYAIRSGDYSDAPQWIAQRLEGRGGKFVTSRLQWLGSRSPLGHVSQSGARPDEIVLEWNAQMDAMPHMRGTRTVMYEGRLVQAQEWRQATLNYILSLDDAARPAAWMEAENAAVKMAADHYNVSPAVAAKIAEAYRRQIGDAMTYMRESDGYLFDEMAEDGTGRILVDPETQRQMQSSFQTLPMAEVIRAIKDEGPRLTQILDAGQDMTIHAYDLVQKLFRTDVLFRPGYTGKNSIIEPLLSRYLAHGTILTDEGLWATLGNVGRNSVRKIERVAYIANVHKLIDSSLRTKSLRAEVKDLVRERYELQGVIDNALTELDHFNMPGQSPAMKALHEGEVRGILVDAQMRMNAVDAALDGKLPEWRQIVEPATQSEIRAKLLEYGAILGDNPGYVEMLDDQATAIVAAARARVKSPKEQAQETINALQRQLDEMQAAPAGAATQRQVDSLTKQLDDATVARDQALDDVEIAYTPNEQAELNRINGILNRIEARTNPTATVRTSGPIDDLPLTAEVPVARLMGMPGNSVTPKKVSKYARKVGKSQPEPVLVLYDPKTGNLVVQDGNHRVAAAAQAGQETITVRVQRSNLGDGYMELHPTAKVEHIGPLDYQDELPYDIPPELVFGAKPMMGTTPATSGMAQVSDLAPLLDSKPRYQTVIDQISGELEAGGSIKVPIRVAYNARSGKAAILNGNHRVEAAIAAGSDQAPIEIVQMDLHNLPSGEWKDVGPDSWITRLGVREDADTLRGEVAVLQKMYDDLVAARQSFKPQDHLTAVQELQELAAALDHRLGEVKGDLAVREGRWRAKGASLGAQGYSGSGNKDMTINIGGERFEVPAAYSQREYTYGEGYRAESSAQTTNQLTFDPSRRADYETGRWKRSASSDPIDPDSELYWDELAYVVNRYFRSDRLIQKHLDGWSRERIALWLQTEEGAAYQKMMGKDYLHPVESYDRIATRQAVVDEPSPSSAPDVRDIRGKNRTYVRPRRGRGPNRAEPIPKDVPGSTLKPFSGADDAVPAQSAPTHVLSSSTTELDRILRIVDQYLPDKAVQRAAAKAEPSAGELQAAMGGRDDLSRIAGDDLNYNPIRRNRVSDAISGALDKIWHLIATMPEDRIARWPFYQAEFRKQITQRAKILHEQGVDLTDEQWNALRQGAHRSSIQELEKTFYNIRRYSTPVYASRFLMTFPGAFFNSLYRYGRFIVREPERVLQMGLLGADIMHRGGIGEDGKPVKNILDAKYLLIPGTSSEGNPGLRIPVSAFSSLTMGYPSLSIGILLASSIAQNIDVRTADFVKAHVGETAFEAAWPYGITDNPVSTLAGGYQRDAWRFAWGIKDVDVKRTAVNTYAYNMYLWEEGGMEGPMPTMDEAVEQASAYYGTGAIVKWFSPFSVKRDPAGQLARNAWSDIQKTYGGDTETASMEFVKMYGDAARWMTYSDTNRTAYIPATMEAHDLIWIEYPELAKHLVGLAPEDPSYVSLLAYGVHGEYNQYVADLMQREPLPGDEQVITEQADPIEFRARAMVSAGWDQYSTAKTRYDAEHLRMRAMRDAATSEFERQYYRDKINGLDQEWTTWVGQLEGANKEWAIDKTGGATEKADKATYYLTEIIGDPKFAAGRGKTPEWQKIQMFLMQRQTAKTAYDEAGSDEEKKALKAEFTDYITQNFTQNDPDFSSLWDRYYASEWDIANGG